MNKQELESFLKKFSKKAYDLAYTLVPDDLQASQIVVDASTNFILTEMDWLHCTEVQSLNKTEEITLKKDFYLGLAREVYQLGVRRSSQLPMSNYDIKDEYKNFYALEGKARTLLFLKYRENLSVEDMTTVTGLNRTEIMNALFQGNAFLEGEPASSGGQTHAGKN